ncbi:HAD family phosphatase [Dorea sp. OM02-2LB]|nr:HAD family phosphatase [Dorea sp. OM02-2LB]
MKKAVIFDLDGLLADSESVSYRLYNGLLEAYGTGFSMETFIENCCGKTMVSNMRSMVKEYDLPISVEECCEWIRSRELDYLEQGVELKKGARNLLVYLKKNSFKILLATSSYKERAVKMLELTGIEEFFDDMVFGTELKRGKPYPDIFLKAAEYAKEPPEHCLVLEDSEAGVQAAYAAGIDVICIPDLKQPSKEYKEKATAVMDSLDEVIGWLDLTNLSK